MHRLWLEALPEGAELTAACGHSVITVLIEHVHGICVGEAVVKDVGAGRGQASVGPVVYAAQGPELF